MDETSVRGLLETALGDEPPIGPVARNSLLAGIRLRRRARIRRATGGAAAVVVVAAVIPAVTGAFGNTPAAPRTGRQFSVPKVPSVPTGTAYVINSGGGTVTPIDLATNTAGKPIILANPADEIVIAPDGRTGYVINAFPSRTVTPIDLVTNKPGKPIVLNEPPYGVVMARDGAVYIITKSVGPPTSINDNLYYFVPFDLATGTPGKPISINGEVGADAIAISPNGAAAYVANQPSDTVTPIDLATSKPGKPIRIGGGWDSGFEAIVTVP